MSAFAALGGMEGDTDEIKDIMKKKRADEAEEAAAAAKNAVASFEPLKSKAGQVKLMAAAAQTETALNYVDEIISLATRWKAKLTPKTTAAEPVDDKEHIAFAVNTTKGGGCDARDAAEDGDLLRVQFIGKIASSGRVVDSSFKTGSVPQKVTLGDGANLECWNRGLRGVCKDERRVVDCPSELAFGGAGVAGKIAPFTDLIYTFTVEDMTKQGETARDAGEKGRARAKKAKKKGGASSGPAVDL